MSKESTIDDLVPEIRGTFCINVPITLSILRINKNLMIGFAVKKPNFVHRFFYKILLGWTWEDPD